MARPGLFSCKALVGPHIPGFQGEDLLTLLALPQKEFDPTLGIKARWGRWRLGAFATLACDQLCFLLFFKMPLLSLDAGTSRRIHGERMFLPKHTGPGSGTVRWGCHRCVTRTSHRRRITNVPTSRISSELAGFTNAPLTLAVRGPIESGELLRGSPCRWYNCPWYLRRGVRAVYCGRLENDWAQAPGVRIPPPPPRGLGLARRRCGPRSLYFQGSDAAGVLAVAFEWPSAVPRRSLRKRPRAPGSHQP